MPCKAGDAKQFLTLFHSAGLYLASGGRDKKLVVWDVEKKEVLSEKDLDAVPVSLAWHPAAKNNTLASIGEDGAIRLWNSVIPSHMLTPSAPLDDPSPRPAHSQEVSHGESLAWLISKPSLNAMCHHPGSVRVSSSLSDWG